MRTYIDGHTRRIIRIEIAALRGARQHIGDAGGCIGRLGFVSFGIGEPLHGSCIDTHGWLADNVWIAGMHVKPLLPSRRTTRLPCASVSMIRADSEMLSGPADIARAIFSCVVSPAFAEVCDSARPTSLSPNTRSKVVAVTAVTMNLRLELSDLMPFLL
jgi:hypothetical protein